MLLLSKIPSLLCQTSPKQLSSRDVSAKFSNVFLILIVYGLDASETEKLEAKLGQLQLDLARARLRNGRKEQHVQAVKQAFDKTIFGMQGVSLEFPFWSCEP